jgi:hypothetical protein
MQVYGPVNHLPGPCLITQQSYQWIRLLGWSDDDLVQVQVHEVPHPAEQMLDLANFRGMRLPLERGKVGTPRTFTMESACSS